MFNAPTLEVQANKAKLQQVLTVTAIQTALNSKDEPKNCPCGELITDCAYPNCDSGDLCFPVSLYLLK
jgi:hypothetical protein